ncbi:AbrB family transcriptional regulator [Microbacterium invictum]
MSSGGRGPVWAWFGHSWRRLAILIAALAACTALMILVGAPAPFLLGPLVGGGIFSLVVKADWGVPDAIRHGGVAVVGAGAGALIDPDAGVKLFESPLAIVGGVVVTIIFSLLTGLLLLLSPHISIATALLGSLAGAASGVSAMARDVEADEVVVAAIQYARVVVVIAAITLAAAVLGAEASGDASAPVAAGGSLLLDLGFTLVSAGGGLVLARLLPFTGAALLYATLLAVVAAWLLPIPVGIPVLILDAGYASIGLAVGFSFTVATVRTLRRVFPIALVQIVVCVAGSAGLGLLFAEVLGVSPLSGFLAMSPGGLPTVAAIAVQAGDDVALIIAMQLLRMFLAIITAVLIAVGINGYSRRARGGAVDGDAPPGGLGI